MKLNAICMLQNEVDIVLDTIEHALKFCDNIYILDNYSFDGSHELVKQKAAADPRVIIIPKHSELKSNQFKSYIYNLYHEQLSASDWWYILDATELLLEDPRPLLIKAMQRYKNQMRVWQANFYFTDRDLQNYENENKTLSIVQRRRYYRINWREPRFFRNSPNDRWTKKLKSMTPPFCTNLYHPSPICLHYSERTPEQIGVHKKVMLEKPMKYLHINNESIANTLKKADCCFYHQPGLSLKFPLTDRINYYLTRTGQWITCRFRRLLKNKQTNTRKRVKAFTTN